MSNKDVLIKKDVRLLKSRIDIVNRVGGTDSFSINIRKVIDISDKHTSAIIDDEEIYRHIEKSVRDGLKKKHDWIAKLLYKFLYMCFMINAMLVTLMVRESSFNVFKHYKSMKSIAHKEIRKDDISLSSLEHLLKFQENENKAGSQ
jgi:hypothetical protein